MRPDDPVPTHVARGCTRVHSTPCRGTLIRCSYGEGRSSAVNHVYDRQPVPTSTSRRGPRSIASRDTAPKAMMKGINSISSPTICPPPLSPNMGECMRVRHPPWQVVCPCQLLLLGRMATPPAQQLLVPVLTKSLYVPQGHVIHGWRAKNGLGRLRTLALAGGVHDLGMISWALLVHRRARTAWGLGRAMMRPAGTPSSVLLETTEVSWRLPVRAVVVIIVILLEDSSRNTQQKRSGYEVWVAQATHWRHSVSEVPEVPRSEPQRIAVGLVSPPHTSSLLPPQN